MKFNLPVLAALLIFAAGCHRITPQTDSGQKDEIIKATDASLQEEKKMQGVDFIAIGQNLNWSLEVDFEKRLLFREKKGTTTIEQPLPPVQPIGNAMVYEVKSGKTELTIRITEVPCRESLTQNQFSHTVTITKNGDEHSGC